MNWPAQFCFLKTISEADKRGRTKRKKTKTKQKTPLIKLGAKIRVVLFLKRKLAYVQDQDETSERQLHLLLEALWVRPQDVAQGEVLHYLLARQEKAKQTADSHSNKRQKIAGERGYQ